LSDSKTQVAQLQSIINTKKRAAKTAKENQAILQYLSTQEELLERIQDLVNGIKSYKFKPAKVKKVKGKKPMTIEVMLSDLHYGKKTDTFDLAVARKRMNQLKDTLIAEIERCNKLYNVERVILALLGDIIESATMHGLESSRGCEFGNSRQVQEAITSIFYDMILPVAMTGLKIDIPAVTGNHDRSESNRTMNDPGEENLTYIIYKTLELLCQQTGLKNVKFYIPKQPYQVLDIYGNTACYEHFDNAKANTRTALNALLSDRQGQIKKIIDFFRGGHFHEATIYGRGRIIVNDSLPGPDSYSNVKGYESHSGQIINYYVPTDERPTCYYRSFPVYLN
jgi:predicted phosphodiesterase